ncbi:hypothetical protein BDK92_7350 [Micromonospora pisi]|uniref:HTH cro/C1-type domain-containing protein n=1 Tax=Micromonospora pisi TaxID=589240 RepID=A0A495JWA7_9ACTN|nr:hypothetical protein BDK92_7350 [Micromonospora pisi]
MEKVGADVVSLPTIKRWENGKIGSPEADKLRAVFRVLGLSVLEIPVLLGLVTREEMDLPPEPVRQFTAQTEELIALVEQGDMSDEEIGALVELLRKRTAKPSAKKANPATKPAPRRQAG